MHNTIIPLDNPFGLGGRVQSFNYPPCLPEDHPHKKFQGQPKGMRVIAQERGYAVDLDDGKRMIGDCMRCKSRNTCKVKGNQPEYKEVNSEESESEDEDGRADTCCLRRLLSMQEDFRGQKCLIQMVRSAPHSSLFLHFILFITGQAIEEGSNGSDVFHLLPKFHPELNPLEYLWGWSKRYFRERSNGKLALAKSLVPTSLNTCPLVTIRRFFRRSERYINVYSLGATGLAAEYAVKKYKSHRGVSQRDLDAAEEERMAKATALQRFS
jgi:transposase